MTKRDNFFDEVIRYSQTNKPKQLHSWLRAMGGWGNMIADMIEVSRSRNLAREVEGAVRILREQGYDVTPPVRGLVFDPPKQKPRVKQAPTVRRAGTRWPRERSIASPVRTVPTGLDQGDISWHQTPESSNVYAFGYDFDQNILYVQYKGEGETGTVRGENSCNGKSYKYKTRPHIPGPVYSYGSRSQPIPEAVYYSMKSAASKGKFVWQNLRVCGSHWEHQVPYQLATVPTPQDGSAPYVPRKAIGPQDVTITDEDDREYQTQTADRFRVRTVPVVGTGRRKAYPSTIQRTV